MKRLKQMPFKWVLIAEFIICYMSVLALISYLRGPMELVQSSDIPLLSSEDFQSFIGEGSPADGAMPLGGLPSGEVSGWLAPVGLDVLDGIWVSFEMESTGIVGEDVLCVDLYNEERGYDAPEQEMDFPLLEGSSWHGFFLPIGKNAPPYALFRVFTSSSGVCILRELQVFPAKLQPHVPVSLYIGVAVCFSILAGTAAVHWIGKQRGAGKHKVSDISS